MLLRSKALDICLERCTAYDDLTAIQQPFMALLSALGGVEMQDITQLALAILHVAERLPTSNFEVSIGPKILRDHSSPSSAGAC